MNYPALSDLNSASIVSPMGTGKPKDIGELAVMVSTAPDLRNIKRKFKRGRDRPFFTSTLFIPDNGEKGIVLPYNCSFTGPYMGAPYGAALLESLIVKGAGKIIIFGWCGSISKEIKTGDILIPDAAISDEGTSRNYVESGNDLSFISPNPSFKNFLINELVKKNIKYKRGNVWTTDAIYRETPEKVNFFKDKGAIAVEMECSALFAVAEYRKKDIAAILVVSDEVRDSGWIPGFRDSRFKNARDKVISVICDICSASVN